jgi:release factor glutamine methyltransferase
VKTGETVGEALRRAQQQLGALHEAERALEHALTATRAQVYLRADEPLSPKAKFELDRVLEGRARGIPLQHLTGTQQFLDHVYRVGPQALIPRPETEFLVRTAVEFLRGSSPKLGWELGLGSGVISIELLAEFGDLRMKATERNPAAAELALENAGSILKGGAWRLEVRQVGESLEAWEPLATDGGRPDFLISNPPYLDPSDPIDGEVLAHEPHSALFVEGAGPLHFYERTAAAGAAFLAPGGRVWLELAPERAAQVKELFVRAGWADVEILTDLAGRERVLAARAGSR